MVNIRELRNLKSQAQTARQQAVVQQQQIQEQLRQIEQQQKQVKQTQQQIKTQKRPTPGTVQALPAYTRKRRESERQVLVQVPEFVKSISQNLCNQFHNMKKFSYLSLCPLSQFKDNSEKGFGIHISKISIRTYSALQHLDAYLLHGRNFLIIIIDQKAKVMQPFPTTLLVLHFSLTYEAGFPYVFSKLKVNSPSQPTVYIILAIDRFIRTKT